MTLKTEEGRPGRETEATQKLTVGDASSSSVSRRARMRAEFAAGQAEGIAKQAAYAEAEKALMRRIGEKGSALPTVPCPHCGAPPLKVCRLPSSDPLKPRELPGRAQHHARLVDHSECVPGQGCPIVDGLALPYARVDSDG